MCGNWFPSAVCSSFKLLCFLSPSHHLAYHKTQRLRLFVISDAAHPAAGPPDSDGRPCRSRAPRLELWVGRRCRCVPESGPVTVRSVRADHGPFNLRRARDTMMVSESESAGPRTNYSTEFPGPVTLAVSQVLLSMPHVSSSQPPCGLQSPSHNVDEGIVLEAYASLSHHRMHWHSKQNSSGVAPAWATPGLVGYRDWHVSDGRAVVEWNGVRRHCPWPGGFRLIQLKFRSGPDGPDPVDSLVRAVIVFRLPVACLSRPCRLPFSSSREPGLSTRQADRRELPLFPCIPRRQAPGSPLAIHGLLAHPHTVLVPIIIGPQIT